jgi:hypothetical protein
MQSFLILKQMVHMTTILQNRWYVWLPLCLQRVEAVLYHYLFNLHFSGTGKRNLVLNLRMIMYRIYQSGNVRNSS